MPWRLPAWPAFTRPLAVTLNRFLQLDFVFILGISVSLFGSVGTRGLGMPLWPARAGSDARDRGGLEIPQEGSLADQIACDFHEDFGDFL
jgi:hypothetical protein